MNTVRTAPAFARQTVAQRLAAGLASVILSTALLGSVAIGMTSTGDGGMQLAGTASAARPA